jgi:hypothetical protein
LGEISRNSGFSTQDTRLTDSIFGLNITGRNSPVPLNVENQGYTFFTRPQLNMSYDNLSADRVMAGLLIDNPNTYHRMIRAYLDPTLAKEQNIDCPAVDPLNPFISLFTNNLIQLSGFPDFTLQTMTSNPGLYREAYSYVDDVPYQYGSFDLQSSMRQIIGDPITMMAYFWGRYSALVYEGRLMPYPEFIKYNAIDYMTRCYRLLMDPTRTYVTRMAATGVSFPINAATGQPFDVNGDGPESPFVGANNQVQIQFRSLGFMVYDRLLIWYFNKHVTNFNPAMLDENRDQAMIKLDAWERDYFSHRAYPRIEAETMELEWYVTAGFYSDNVAKLQPRTSTVG